MEPFKEANKDVLLKTSQRVCFDDIFLAVNVAASLGDICLLCHKELKLTTNPFTGHTYTSRPSVPDAEYQFAKFGHAQKAKFQDFGLKVTQQS